MIKKYCKKISTIILNVLILIYFTTTKVFAANGINLNLDLFKPSVEGGVKNASKLGDMAGVIIGVLQAIGVVASVCIIIVIGIKYMLGSVEEKAEYKEEMKPYIIGSALLFVIPNLVQIIYTFAVNI